MKNDWLRYSCQLSLPGFGEEGQKRLQQAKVLIVGAGGLGCPSAQYLAACGVGTIGIVDYDIISTSNLHRQILFNPSETGLFKSEVACRKLQFQNPGISIKSINKKITSDNVMQIIAEYDIVVDGTDNFETKYLLNDACVLSNKPLVYGAIYQFEGQVAVLNATNKDGSKSPNYRDLFPKVNASQIPNCAEGGVIPTIAGITGCVQANEVIKFITGTGELLAGKIFIIDARTLQSRVINTWPVTNTVIEELIETEVVNTISVAVLQESMDENLYELIDVRTPEERKEFNIGGRHMPLSELEKEVLSIEKNRPVVFYCETGRRSELAVKNAKEIFPQSIFYSLEGGLKFWKKNSISNQKI